MKKAVILISLLFLLVVESNAYVSLKDIIQRYGYGSNSGQNLVPVDFTYDENDNFYIVDAGNHKVNKYDSSGNFMMSVSRYGGPDGYLQYPNQARVNGNGAIYILDKLHGLQKFDSNGNFIQKVISFGAEDWQLEGESSFDIADGEIYVADLNNARVRIFSSDCILLETYAFADSQSPVSEVSYRGIKYLSGSTIQISTTIPVVITASDDFSGVKEFRIIDNGVETIIFASKDKTEIKFSEGMHNINISAYDYAGNMEPIKTFQIDATDIFPPIVPVGLTSNLIIPGSYVKLNWNANTETDLAGYNVYRNGIKITELPILTTDYSDINFGARGATYSYEVTAVDTVGNESRKSESVSIFVPVEEGIDDIVMYDVYTYQSHPEMATYGYGDTVDIIVWWWGRRIPGGSPVVSASVDFSYIDSNYSAGMETIELSPDGSSARIKYTISKNNTKEPGNYAIPITATNQLGISGTYNGFIAILGRKPFYKSQDLGYGKSPVFGDYDNDGDLDITAGYGNFIKVFKNDSGQFTVNQDIPIPGTISYRNSLLWVDYNNDGNLDIICSGGNFIKIVKNENNIFIEDTTQNITGILGTNIQVGDYNNDGYTDLISGSKLYWNDKGIFKENQAGQLPNISESGFAFGDYDNDGDLDLALAGGQFITKIYKNNNGSFSEDTSQNYLVAMAESPNVQWIDYNNDGKLDLSIKGYAIAGNNAFNLYKNDNGIINKVLGIDGPGEIKNGFAWCDVDNNGGLDLITDKDIHYNDNGIFSRIQRITDTAGIWWAGGNDNVDNILSGDIDNDGNVDLLTTNWGLLEVYRNCKKTYNNLPAPPTNLFTNYSNEQFVFTWDAGSDVETPTNGLYYNVRIGTTPGGNEIVSGKQSSPLTGNYLRPKISDIQLGVKLNIAGNTTYYWSVQTIDTALKTSEWSPEQAVYIQTDFTPPATRFEVGLPNKSDMMPATIPRNDITSVTTTIQPYKGDYSYWGGPRIGIHTIDTYTQGNDPLVNLNFTPSGTPEFIPGVTESSPLVLYLSFEEGVAPFTVRQNDTITITYDNGKVITVYLPYTKLVPYQAGGTPQQREVTLYVSSDGSTYYDQAFTKVACLAPGSQPNYLVSKNTLIGLSAADEKSEVKDIKYKIDGGEWAVYQSSFTFGEIAGAEHTVYFYAADKLNNIEEIKSVKFTIDKTPPLTVYSISQPNKIVTPNQPALIPNFESITTTIAPYKGNRDYGNPRCYYMGENLYLGMVFNPVLTMDEIYSSPELTPSPFHLYFVFEEGDKSFTIKQTDTFNVTYDGNKKLVLYLPHTELIPSYIYSGGQYNPNPNARYEAMLYAASDGSTYYDAAMTQPAHLKPGTELHYYVNRNTPITFNSGDEEFNVKKTYYKIDEGIWQEYVSSFMLDAYSEGEHTVYFYSIDEADNAAPVQTVRFTIDATPPVTDMVISEPKYETPEKIYVTAQTSFTLTSEDNLTGVKEIMYNLDNDFFNTYKQPFTLPEMSRNCVTNWKFDEGSGSVVNDSAGSNIGTLINGPQWVEGKIGSGLYFDGIDDYISVPASSSYNGIKTGITISMWLKREDTAGRSVLSNGVWGQEGGFWVYTSGSDIYFVLAYPPQQWLAAAPFPVGEMAHFAATWSETDKTMRIYINGIQSPVTLPFNGPITSGNTELRIGHTVKYNVGNGHFKGILDEVAIYNGALKPDEIRQLYLGEMPQVKLLNGEHTLSYYSVDNLNNSEVPKTKDLVYDDIPPEIVISSPVGGQVFKAGDSIYVNVAVNDLSPVNTTAYFTLVESPDASKIGSKFAVNNGDKVEPLDLPYFGFYTLTAEAEDVLGHKSSTTTARFEVVWDTLPPRTAVVTGEPKYVSATSTYVTVATSFTLTVVDDLAVVGDGCGLGVKETKYKIDDGNWTVHSGTFTLPASAPDLPAGCVSNWKFDEGSGNAANDSAGANGGIIYGATWVYGKSGKALQFSGDGYVFVPNNPSLSLGQQFSISLWAKFDNLSKPYNTLIFKGSLNPYSIYSLYAEGNKLYWSISGLSRADGRTAAVLSENVWYNIILTYDSSNVKIFLNGLLVYSESRAGNPAVSIGDLMLGRTLYGSQYDMEGSIDEVVMYNRALNADEIQQLYQMAPQLKEGAHNISYRSVDNLNNEEDIKTDTVIFDATPPETEFSLTGNFVNADSPAGEGVIEIGEYNINESTEIYSVNGSSPIYVPPGYELVFSTNPGHIYLVPLDAGGAIKPAGKWVNFITSETELVLTSSDTYSGVKETKYSVDNLPITRYSLPVTLSGPDGLYTVKYQSEDNLGHLEVERSTEVYLDNTAPASQLQITNYKFQINDNIYVSTLTQFAITADDNHGSGVKEIKYSVDGLPFSTYYLPLTTYGLSEGEHTVSYYSSDLLNNTEVIKTQRVLLDKSAPETVVEIAQPKYETPDKIYVTSQTTFTFTATDNLSGVKETRWRIENGNWKLYAEPFKLSYLPVIPALPDGCISNWKFEEGSGNIANDSAGTNNGSLINGPQWTTGHVGNAISFDGSNDYVGIPNIPLTDKFTFESWAYYTRPDSEESGSKWLSGLVAGLNGASNGYNRILIRSDMIHVTLKIGNNYYYHLATVPISKNVWHHYGVTYDGGYVKIYLDGTLVYTGAQTGNLDNDSMPTRIGAGSTHSSYWDWYLFEGKIDEAALYDRALTAEEIQVRAGLVAPITELADGEHTISYFSSDNVDNKEPVKTKTLVLDNTPPAKINDLAVSAGPGLGEITLTWTSPGDDGTVGNITDGKYRIVYADVYPVASSEIIWSTNTASGAAETKVITGLADNTTYWFYMLTADKLDNRSIASDTKDAKTYAISQSADGNISIIYGTAMLGEQPVNVFVNTESTTTERAAIAISSYTESGFGIFSNLYDIGPTGAVFSAPAVMTFYYTDPVGLNEAYLNVYKYDDPGGWQALVKLEQDTVQNYIKVEVASLSLFAVMLDVKPPDIVVNSPVENKKYVATVDKIKIDFAVTDNTDPHPQFSFYLTDLEEGTTMAVMLGQEIEPFSIDDGFWSLTVNALDRVGNISSKTVKFEVVHDILPPRTEIAVSEPKYENAITYVTGNTSFTLTAIDDLVNIGDGIGTGVKVTEYRIDTGIWTTYTNPFRLGTSPAVDPSCVAYWKFDEGSGNTLYDLSGNGNNGTIYGASWVDGRFGKALMFDGLSNYVKVPDNVSLDITDKFTVEGWIYETSQVGGSFRTIVSKHPTTLPRTGFAFKYLPTSLRFDECYGLEGDGDWEWNTVSYALDLSKWYHVAVTYDSSDWTKIKLYVNGQVVSWLTGPPGSIEPRPIGQLSTNNMPLIIGAGYQSLGEFFEGFIDELGIYNRVLTAEEIMSRYTGAAQPILADGPHTISYYSEDKVGNVELAKTKDVYLDNGAPVINIVSPLGGEKFIATQNKINVSYAITDAGPYTSNAYLTDVEEATKVSVVNGQMVEPLSLDDGFWTLTVEATDWAGHFVSSTTASFEVIHDILPPRTDIAIGSSKYNGFVTSGTEFTLSAVDDLINIDDEIGLGIKEIKYRIDESEWQIYTEPFNIPAESSHTITYYSSDVIGNTEQVKTFGVTVDNTAPTTEISLLLPKYTADNKLWVSSETAVSLSATDGGIIPCGVKYTEYKIDNGFYTLLLSYSLALSLSDLSEGEHTITYRSIDNVNNTELEKTINLITDNSAPETYAGISEPKYNEYITSDSQFILVAVDSGTLPSGIKETEYSISISTSEFLYQKYISTFNISGADGIYTAAYYSIDNVENMEEVSINVVKLDNTKPVSNLALDGIKCETGGKTYITPETQIIITAQDPQVNNVASGLKEIFYLIDDLPVTRYSLPITLSEGIHTVKYYSVDNLGNTEQTNEKTVYVDGTAPVTGLTAGEPKYIAFGETYILPSTPVTLTAIDPVSNGVASGIKNTEYRIDSGEWLPYISSFTLSEGVHTVSYRSMDNLQNTEETKTAKFTVTYICEYAAFGADGIKVNGQGKIYGDAGSNGQIKLDGQALIDGDVFASSVTIAGQSIITGAVTQNAIALSTSAIDLSAIQNYVYANNDNDTLPKTQKGKQALINGVLTLSGQDSLTVSTGTYYLAGIKLSGQTKLYFTGEVRIFCTGNVQVSGQSELHHGVSPYDLIIYCSSGAQSVQIGGQGEMHSIIYAPESDVSVSGQGITLSNVFAGRVSVSGQGKIVGVTYSQQPMLAAGITRPAPAPDFTPGEIYSYPNPAKRGKRPTLHIECGVADKVEIRIYNIAAELVDSTELYGTPQTIRNKYAYEYTWDISDIASGVYIYTIRAKKNGYSDIKKQGKCAVIK